VAGELHLSGELADEGSHQKVSEAAQALLQPPRLASVRDELQVGAATPSEGALAVALRGVQTVGRCDSGEASLQGGVFSLRCELARQVEPAVREQAQAALPEGYSLGEVVLLVTEEIASCEDALGALLQSATIEFETESAEIGQSSEPLLDKVAAQARQCPGTLRVEGHTDNQGAVEFNRDLSQRRAASVRQALVKRGLPEERLVAQGFGDSKPKETNATAAGRAHNRRIEIKVVRSHE
jgi:outer membrane protein OmpA-like peptidoglycan-associated protein